MLTPFTQKALHIVNTIYSKGASYHKKYPGRKGYDLWQGSRSCRKTKRCPAQGYELQKALLESEDIKFFKPDTINLKYYLWNDSASMKRLPVF